MRKMVLFVFLLLIAANISSNYIWAGVFNRDPAITEDPVQLDIYPELISEIIPLYPDEAKKNKVEGKVYLKLQIDKGGNVSDVLIQKSSGSSLLDESASIAAEQFKFKPAILNGQPVVTWVTIPVEFKLDDNDESKQEIMYDMMPEMIKQTTPEYPVEAKRKKLEGDVWVKALIDKNGKVTEALIQKSTCIDCGFEQSALKSALDYIFKPAVKNNEPVAAWITFKISFKLDTK